MTTALLIALALLTGPDGRSCEQVRGTEYISEAERSFYLSECLTVPQASQTMILPAVLFEVRACESHDDYGAVSRDNRYFGAYQFDLPTWRAVGGQGNPAQASPQEQDYRALLLFQQRGLAPWPHCGGA